MKTLMNLLLRPSIFSDRRSIAALEFALVAPLIFLLGLGAVEFAAAIRVNLSVDRTARTVAELIATAPVPLYQTQAKMTTTLLQDDYIAGQDCATGLAHSLTISAASLVYSPGNSTPNSSFPASGAGTSTSPWDASKATGLNPAYVATPSSAISAASGLGDNIDTDSVIVVQVKAAYSLPFFPTFGGIFGIGKISTGPFSSTATAFARPRSSLIIAQGF